MLMTSETKNKDSFQITTLLLLLIIFKWFVVIYLLLNKILKNSAVSSKVVANVPDTQTPVLTC